jgi:molecular chaperone GrpE
MGRIKDEVQEQSLSEEQEQQQQDGAAQAEADQDSSAQLQTLTAERDALLDRLARQQAEFDNIRKRMQKEQADYRDYALVDFAKQFLPILDSFDRALASRGSEEKLHEGMELIRRQLEDALGKIGVKAVAAKGEQFDPRFHEAIEMVETSDAKDNEVIDEMQRGYQIKDRLLRPAMVRVAKNH